MPFGLPDPKELGFYFTVSQVGLEMVVPVVVGLVLDSYLNWTPWGIIGGATLGFVVGIVHLITLVNQANQDSPRRRDGS